VETRISTILDWLLNSALRENLTYREFFKLLLASYGYNVPRGRWRGEHTGKLLKSLVEEMHRAKGTYRLHPLKLTLKRIYRRYNVYVVDCLGLPELYWIYYYASQKYGETCIDVNGYINEKALTSEFTETFEARSMLEVADMYRGHRFKPLDTAVHKKLGTPMRIEMFLDTAEAVLLRAVKRFFTPFLDGIERMLIVSDHGYDVYCEDGKYYATHIKHRPAVPLENLPSLSKLSVMLTINC